MGAGHPVLRRRDRERRGSRARGLTVALGGLFSNGTMKQVSFYEWRVEVDPEATRAAYEQFESPDPRCCNACAAFLEAARRQSLPVALTDFLTQAGAAPEKIQEVWGAPDGGFLNGWWVVVGRLPDAAWDGEGETAYVEAAPGFKCWVTDKPSMGAPEAMEGHPILQLEFEWNDERLVELGAVWTAAARRQPPPNGR